MTDLAYLLWIGAMALMIITVLTVGTLAAAGLLTRRTRPEGRPPGERTPVPGQREERREAA